MGKDKILSDLNDKKNQLGEARKRLKNLEEKYETLEDFTHQCNTRIQAFDDSMRRRKNRLTRIDSLLGSVKSAKRYKNKMNDMLVGPEFIKASASINNLETTASAKKTQIKNDITSTEKEILHLEQAVEKLQYSYDTYQEVDEDV